MLHILSISWEKLYYAYYMYDGSTATSIFSPLTPITMILDAFSVLVAAISAIQ
jgi:hypothetical protein